MLTDEQQQEIFTAMVQNFGCPVTATDRVEAFIMGMKAAIKSMAQNVSVDIERNE